MSTKIYDAYIVSRDVNFQKDIIEKSQEIAWDTLRNDSKYLILLHAAVMAKAYVLLQDKEKIKTVISKDCARVLLSEDKAGNIRDLNLISVLSDEISAADTEIQCSNDLFDTIFDINMQASFTWDKDYYVKFFVHDYALNIIENIEHGIPMLKDFHYQNSTDNLPEGVSREEFEMRGKKWDSLLDGKNTFAHWPLFVVIDGNMVYNRLMDSYLDKRFSDLSYKFDKKPEQLLSNLNRAELEAILAKKA
jgi:hypothetical protein